MILFTPPSEAELQRLYPRQVTDRDAYVQNGQMLYAPPGSDLARGILSRSPLAAYLYTAPYDQGTCFYQLDSQHPQGLIANCVLRIARKVSFQENQMKVLLAIPNETAPVEASLSFRPETIRRLLQQFNRARHVLTNNCFGGAIANGVLGEVLNEFPTWRVGDLEFRIPGVPLQRRTPYFYFLNLILCCEVGYCPVRLFQLLGIPASEVIGKLTPLPQSLRARLDRNLADLFAPSADAQDERAIATYADLPRFLGEYKVAQSDLAAALHIAFPLDPELASKPLPQEALELIDYAKTHDRAELRQELLRRAGPEHACTLWSAQDLCSFRTCYCFTQSLLEVLFPSEPIALAQWENGEADIPFSICKGLDNLQRAFELLFPCAERSA